MRGFDEIDDLLGGDDMINAVIKPNQRVRMLEESKSPELYDSIKSVATAWLKSHFTGVSDDCIADTLRIASIQETYDSDHTNPNEPISRESSGIRSCDYRFVSTIDVGDDVRLPVNINLSFRVGGY